LPARWYNVSIKSNKTYYNPGYTLVQNPFFIKTKPVLEAPNVTSQQGSDIRRLGRDLDFQALMLLMKIKIM